MDRPELSQWDPGLLQQPAQGRHLKSGFRNRRESPARQQNLQLFEVIEDLPHQRMFLDQGRSIRGGEGRTRSVDHFKRSHSSQVFLQPGSGLPDAFGSGFSGKHHPNHQLQNQYR